MGSLAVGLGEEQQSTITKFYLVGNRQMQYNTDGEGSWITMGF